jgi:hypothetical protein
VFFDQPQQMSLRNLIFQAELVEQCFGTGVLSHMISRPPRMAIKKSMARNFLLFITTLLSPFICQSH